MNDSNQRLKHDVSNIGVVEFSLSYEYGHSVEASHKLDTTITNNKQRRYVCNCKYELLSYKGTTPTQTGKLGIVTCKNMSISC